MQYEQSFTEGMISPFKRLIRNVHIEITTAWKHKNLQKIWNQIIHVIGFVSYATIVSCVAIFLFVAFLILKTQSRMAKKMSTASLGVLDLGFMKFFLELIEGTILFVFRLFAGVTGWGAYTATPMQIPRRMMESVSKQVTPSQTTQIIGYLTLAFFGWQLVSFITAKGGYMFSGFFYRLRRGPGNP